MYFETLIIIFIAANLANLYATTYSIIFLPIIYNILGKFPFASP